MKIIAISDTHSQHEKVTISPCDVLIVAGDICPDGIGGMWGRDYPDVQEYWFKTQFLRWAEKQPATRVLATWGNHDFCRYTHYHDGKVDLIVDAEVEIDGVRFWLTPWSNQFMEWAWMKDPTDLRPHYDLIPEGIDVIVSHQPPRGYGDLYPNLVHGEMEHIASGELLETIERVRPRFVVCGHLHGGYGTYHHGGTTILNVSVVNEQYRVVNPATGILITGRVAR